ncbi:MAG TPA: MoxR family ATPase, partial [Saprospiraceae bacterium]|nr:MoxR family ATPase [Saprospiraceae bacterium]
MEINEMPESQDSEVQNNETEAPESGTSVFENRLDVSPVKRAADLVRGELHKVIIGQDKMLDQLLAALFCGGHVLVEGVPGIAKTLTAKLLAQSLKLDFSRIQFTPDLMP